MTIVSASSGCAGAGKSSVNQIVTLLFGDSIIPVKDKNSQFEGSMFYGKEENWHGEDVYEYVAFLLPERKNDYGSHLPQHISDTQLGMAGKQRRTIEKKFKDETAIDMLPIGVFDGHGNGPPPVLVEAFKKGELSAQQVAVQSCMGERELGGDGASRRVNLLTPWLVQADGSLASCAIDPKNRYFNDISEFNNDHQELAGFLLGTFGANILCRTIKLDNTMSSVHCEIMERWPLINELDVKEASEEFWEAEPATKEIKVNRQFGDIVRILIATLLLSLY